MTDIVVVCPTAFERRSLGAKLGRLDDVQLLVCGPGPAAVRRWADTIESGSTVILAGVAGGLTPAARLGEASAVHEVWHPTGEVTQLLSASTGRTWRVAGADRLVATRDAKRELARRSSAAIVDMESHAFVAEAAQRGWRSAIVRGVSDTCDEELDAEIESLVDGQGRIRIVATSALLLRRPTLLPILRSLGRRTQAAMDAVAPIVMKLIAQERERAR